MALHPSQLVSVAPFLMSDDIGLPYSPALLLDAGFGASITDDSDFSFGCRGGFESFVEGMYGNDKEGNEVFVGCSYAWCDVEREIVENVVRRYNAFEKHFGADPLPWRAGFMLGWLSVLVLVNRSLALQGLDLLSVLVPACQREEIERAA